MTDTANGRPVVDRQVYVENRGKFSPEDLLPYAGQWLAWSADGSRIVAHHADLGQVLREVEQSGLSRDDVVLDHLPTGGEVDAIL